jgi:hypothetical protein
VSPLTCSAKDGGKYVRFEDVEGEIAKALAAEPSTWDVEALKSEVLVHLIRVHRWREDMMDVLGRLFDQLGRRVAVIVGDNSKGFSKMVREDLLDRISQKVVELVLIKTPTRTSEFLEIAFRKKVKGLTLNLVESRQSERGVAHFPIQGAAATEDFENKSFDQGVVVVDDGPGPEEIFAREEQREIIWMVLNGLDDPRHREAFILHHFHGWRVKDDNPTNPSLCRKFRHLCISLIKRRCGRERQLRTKLTD